MRLTKLKPEVLSALIASALETHTRAEGNRPVAFSAVVDKDAVTNSGAVESVAHVLVLSTAQVLEIEDDMRKKGLIALEVTGQDFP